MYCRDCWWSDKWNDLERGREYDFSKSFFEQLKELLYITPHISIFNANTVNSDWVNQETDDKNCYLNVGGHYNEDSAYNTYSIYGKQCFDNFWVLNSELCYESVNCDRCFRTMYSDRCFDCMDTILSLDCRNCQNVIGCAGLRNKSYCIFNEQSTKEQYEKFLKNNPISSLKIIANLRVRAEEIWRSMPQRYAFILKSVNSTGHFINECKNAVNSWNAEKSEHIKNLYIGGWMKDSQDLTSHGAAELTYECANGGGVYASKFTTFCMAGNPLQGTHSSYLEYCYGVTSCGHCFGCVNLKNKQYCILNKQYTKEEYEILVPKIIAHMNEMPYTDKKGRIYKYGEFFPTELAPFGYNETAAQDYYPLSKDEAVAKGFQWSDYEPDTKYEFSDYLIPDDIKDVGDGILNKILKCEVSGKAYKIIPTELQFYRKMNIPLPRRSPLVRHKDRMARLLPRRLYKRMCDCVGDKSKNGVYTNTAKHQHGSDLCNEQIETPYGLDRKEIIYCEQCYQQEVS
jgi:hypothetical protein